MTVSCFLLILGLETLTNISTLSVTSSSHPNIYSFQKKSAATLPRFTFCCILLSQPLSNLTSRNVLVVLHILNATLNHDNVDSALTHDVSRRNTSP